MPRSARLLAVLLLLPACAIPGRESKLDHPPGAEPGRMMSTTLPTATDMQYTATYEIRFGNELVGYLVDVLPTPEGMTDARGYPPGTALIQDPALDFIGFITPGGKSYRFDENGEGHAVGFGSRNENIAAFFRANGQPTLVSIHPGTIPSR
jgi:hypothetical protein